MADHKRVLNLGLLAMARAGSPSAWACAGRWALHAQVEHMNRTLKDATVRRYHYGSHDELRAHLQLFLDAYNHARRLKALRGHTPYEFICQAWTQESERFRVDPSHHIPGLNTQGIKLLALTTANPLTPVLRHASAIQNRTSSSRPGRRRCHARTATTVAPNASATAAFSSWLSAAAWDGKGRPDTTGRTRPKQQWRDTNT